MNAVSFAEEFTNLIFRWTKPGEGGDGPPLTNQQLLNAIRDVVQILLGVSLQVPDYSSVRTPGTGITICTPNAPTVPRLTMDSNNTSLARFRSLDTLTFCNAVNISNNDTLISKSQEKIETLNGDQAESTPEQKKFISRSSPAIHVNSVARSDTFIREEEEKAGGMNKKKREAEEKDQISLDPEKMKSNSFLKKIAELRECAYDVISKIDQVKKDVYPETTKPIRRLSSIGTYSGSNRTSTLMRPTQAPKLRRSTSAFPGTPTSSKLNTTITAGKDEATAKRKSMATSKISPTICTPSMAIKKISPLSSGKPAKNPKYAHVQSTISKTLVNKRKT